MESHFLNGLGDQSLTRPIIKKKKNIATATLNKFNPLKLKNIVNIGQNN